MRKKINSTKINKVKYFGIKKNIREYQQIIKNHFKKEDIEKIVDSYFGKESIEEDLLILLGANLTEEELMKITKLFENSFDKGGKRVLNTKGKSILMGKVLNKQALQVLISQQGIYFSNIIREVAKQIGNILAKAYKEGLGIREVKKQIVEKIPDMAEHRAERIARSEFIKASATGTKQGMKEAGIKNYIWVSAQDSKVCPLCQKLDGKTFRVDDETSPLPVKDSHPNCRCCIISK
jgi:SPP1 gp7 family putative phage head morphogenesis protein